MANDGRGATKRVSGKRGERVDGDRRTWTAGLIVIVLAVTGCGQAGPDPQAEVQQKVEADAMMQQYNTPAPSNAPAPSSQQ
jgi:predicted small lipoprotein YifL